MSGTPHAHTTLVVGYNVARVQVQVYVPRTPLHTYTGAAPSSIDGRAFTVLKAHYDWHAKMRVCVTLHYRMVKGPPLNSSWALGFRPVVVVSRYR